MEKSGMTEEVYKFFVIFLLIQENFTDRESPLNLHLSVPHQSSGVTFAPGRVKHNFMLRRSGSLSPFTEHNSMPNFLYVPAEGINLEKGFE